jgi:hypothetical protein
VNPLPFVSLSNDYLCIYDSPVTLTSGFPAGGIYSGNGISNGIFDPGTAGIGPSVIEYTYVDSNNCENSVQSLIVVDDCAGLGENVQAQFIVFPNPSIGIFTISSDKLQIEYIRVLDATGRLVAEQEYLNEMKVTLDLLLLANGMYTAEITSGKLIEYAALIINK